ncbi:MAG: MFS transporter [Chloroflexi bacterium]|nr:MFS transporter [Chloroflexota bacterium]
MPSNEPSSHRTGFKTRIAPYVALIPVCAGVFIAADDQTVIVTVLPQIMLDMKVDVIKEVNLASWTITGYLLGYVAAMPLIGKVSDVWGHRRVFILSMALFMLFSVAVALTTQLSWMIAARVFQALGAGALVPVSIAIVGDLFPPERRGIPLGIVGGAAEAGGVIGPLWGGIIIRYLDWQWVFWINIPLGAGVLILLAVFLKPSPRYPGKVDYVGGALIALAIATLTLGLARINALDLLMVAYLVISAISLAFFVVRQKTTLSPLVPLAMFRSWAFSAANGTHLLVGGALIIGMVTIPLMANTAMALTPLEGGLRLMRLTAAIPIGALLGGIACQRMDYRAPTILGLALAALGFWFMSQWDLQIADPWMTLHLATTGLGFGLVIAPIALAATNSVEEGVRGTAAGLITATRMIGMTLGLATLTAWGAGRFQDLVADIQLFPTEGETVLQAQQRFGIQVTDAGLSLFNNFFLIAMSVCLLAIVPAAFMVWKRGQEHS